MDVMTATPPVPSPAPAASPVLSLDRRTQRVLVRGADVPLTRVEFRVLEVLLADPGAAVPRERLVAAVGPPTGSRYRNHGLDVHISSIRRKLAAASPPGGRQRARPERERYIETVRGFGYRLSDEAL